ncbi:hypothetical protein, partial [Gluconobacter sp. DsW_056]|uniref:hypothetical protein n=1 Tax=Gluconobacter sp. DsW_056 TaxID=1511209 RepID=UPI001E35F52F
ILHEFPQYRRRKTLDWVFGQRDLSLVHEAKPRQLNDLAGFLRFEMVAGTRSPRYRQSLMFAV